VSRPGRRWAAALVLAMGAAACGESARLPIETQVGPSPEVPPPRRMLVPTVKIATARGWDPGAHPISPLGARVTAFGTGLQHPRWVYVLPNGDVVVAETNAPSKPDDSRGLRGWVTRRYLRKAGAVGPSANRITLLRDADHDGRAEQRSVFARGLQSPLGMALVGTSFFVADTDAVLRFNYAPGAMRVEGQPAKLVDLPAGR